MAHTDRDRYLQRTYGITQAQYEEILDHQGGKCAICRRPPKAGKNLHVDHDHRSGAVRGLLCVVCNHELLGRRDKDPGLFYRAGDYLCSPPAGAVLDEGHTVPSRPKRRRRKKPSGVRATSHGGR